MDLERIYETLIGERLDPYPGIDNAFADGSRCSNLYREIFAASQRICDRLGQEEDPDLELILDHFWSINRELCRLSFRYGQKHPDR